MYIILVNAHALGIAVSNLLQTLTSRSTEARAPLREGPLKGHRRSVARNLTLAWQRTVPATIHARLEAETLALPSRFNAYDRILFSVVEALKAFPQINATYDGEILREHAQVNLGIALDTPRGLLIPVIAGADAMTIDSFTAARGTVSEAARSWKHRREDLEGGTFTVSNLGPLGIEHATPVAFGDQVAILALGPVQQISRRLLGEPEARACWVLPVSLTFNHCVIDGADAARFLKAVEAALSHN